MTYDDTNIFAGKILRGELPACKFYETDHVLGFMDIMPRGDGHALVIPKVKARDILDAKPEAVAELMRAVRWSREASKQAFGADGITIQAIRRKRRRTGGVPPACAYHPALRGLAAAPAYGEMASPEVWRSCGQAERPASARSG